MSLNEIEKRLAAAELERGIEIGSTMLIAVSKVQPNERVKSVLDQSHKCFGENRVQEAASKWPGFRQQFSDLDLHLVGPLQSNKARQAMEIFDAIHSLDRPKLANTLGRIAQEVGKCPDIFIQVNTGKELQKSGVMPEDTDSFVDDCRKLDLPLRGLMCIPPNHEPASLHFGMLAHIAERNGLSGLSMGMSGDFEEAVRFGATHVRVGSAIFGGRVHGAKQ
jgi:PLP dependent protein